MHSRDARKTSAEHSAPSRARAPSGADHVAQGDHPRLSVQTMMAAGGNQAMVQLSKDAEKAKSPAKDAGAREAAPSTQYPPLPKLIQGGPPVKDQVSILDPHALVTGLIIDVTGLGWDNPADSPAHTDPSIDFGEAARDPKQKKTWMWKDIESVVPSTDLARAGANPLRVPGKATHGMGKAIHKHVFLMASELYLIRAADAWQHSGFLRGGRVVVHERPFEEEFPNPPGYDEMMKKRRGE